MAHFNKSNYLFSIDGMRIIAILAVLLIHSTTTTLQLSKHDVDIAIFPLILNQIARFAVPLFFLISGFVLELSCKNSFSLLSYLKKRAFKIILPFVVWSIFYTLAGNNWDVASLFRFKFATSLIDGSASYHLYFVPTLLLLYLVFPLIHQNLRFVSKKSVLFAIIFANISLSIVDYYAGRLMLPEVIRIALLSITVFTIGMVTSHHKDLIQSFTNKYFSKLLIFLLILISGITIHVYFLTILNNTSGYIYNQYGPLNFVYTLLVALFLFALFEKKKPNAFLISLSRLSFFVFFIHVFVQFLVIKNVTLNLFPLLQGNKLLYLGFDIIQFVLISTISFGIAYLIHKIPYASKITG